MRFTGFMVIGVLASACAMMPPVKDLQPGDLSSLAGTWRGILLRGAPPAEWWSEPVEIVILANGSFTGRRPQINHDFGGQVAIGRGKLVIRTRSETGDLVLREGDGTRVLEGDVLHQTERRGNYRLRLEWASSDTTPPASQPASRTSTGTSPPSRSTAMPNLKGIYKGNVLLKQGTGNAMSDLRLNIMLSDPSTLGGTWKLAESEGMVTGHPIAGAKIRLRLLQSEPCEGEFGADVTVADNGAMLTGSLTGTSPCRGSLTGPFSLFRQ